MNHRIVRLALASLLLMPAAAVACDREDVRDAEEVGKDVENEVDQLDSDGKDD